MPQFKKSMALYLCQLLVYLLQKSYRYRVLNFEFRQKAETMHPKGSLCIASWHQNCFAGILAHAHQGFTILVSRSFDGELVSQAAKKLGVDSVRGSSSRGGQEALEELILKTHGGLKSAITVDGPKGPAYTVKSGILRLSAECTTPILPMLAIADRYWTLSRSWDRFRLPKPFAKVYVIYGEAYSVSREELASESERLKLELRDRLHHLESYLPQAMPVQFSQRLQKERESLGAQAPKAHSSI